MEDETRCPRCGEPLAPEGLCLRCVLQLGLESGAGAAFMPTLPLAAEELPSASRVGPYNLIDVLGEGGMGIVYLAEQEEPIRRQVALKIIKLGMDTREVISRFEAERQALAMMEHPCIAQVHDAGATREGRPYFAMEYVKGVPITEHCDRQRLSVGDRLALFVEVCAGVQHAHFKGIVHRDLKPSNVIISLEGDKARPKIIDFGLAKATAPGRLAEATAFTRHGLLLGTPEYMSPEQAALGGHDIDTRTDVYSLGVLLYELLVGALPFERPELSDQGYDEIRRQIREDDPPRPSARLSSLGQGAVAAARCRGSEPSKLVRRLRGDLDWIVLKALEKDRGRRYSSPAELAADIGRHLRHEPIAAGPPGRLYRARKFVRRHRMGVGAAAAGLLMLVVFAGTMAVQARRIARERDRANLEAATAQRVSEFLSDLFKVSDPSEAQGNSITARQVLDKGAQQIEEELADEPELQARLMSTMGWVYQNLGLYSRAEQLLERAVATRTRALGAEHPDTLHSMNDLAVVHWRRGRYGKAERLHLEVLEKRKHVLGDTHPDTLASMHNLAIVYSSQGRYSEAEPLKAKTFAIRRRILGDDHPATLRSMNNLANLYRDQARYSEAETLYLETVGRRKRVFGADHPETLSSMSNLALLYWYQGRYDEAEPLYVEIVHGERRVLGPEHPETLRSMNNLAITYQRQGLYSAAEALHLEVLEVQKRRLGANHPKTATTMYSLACLRARLGDQTKALDWLRQSVAAGWADIEAMIEDSDLESLHGPELDALVAQARNNAAAQTGQGSHE